MYYFTSDYTTGCTPEILEVLGATNLEETAGYGEDAYCEAARALIQKECGRPDADVYFMMAGTQTNLTIISASLRPFHGVYGTARSHINTHEAGAIERSGHKVLVVPDEDGKITAAQIAAEQEKYLHDPSREHIVMPKMVYISQPTETGTLYSKKELAQLLGMSNSDLQRKFIQEFGEPVSVWLQKQKNQKILSRLSYDSISIKEIAHEFGFLSASSFNKYCKCNFGYNPTELKKQIKERRIESSVFQCIK